MVKYHYQQTEDCDSVWHQGLWRDKLKSKMIPMQRNLCTRMHIHGEMVKGGHLPDLGCRQEGRERGREKRRLRRNQACQHFNLGLPASRTMRKKCRLWELPICGILLQEWWQKNEQLLKNGVFGTFQIWQFTDTMYSCKWDGLVHEDKESWQWMSKWHLKWPHLWRCRPWNSLSIPHRSPWWQSSVT